VYDVNLIERVGLDIEFPTILCAIRWGKLYNEPHLGSHLLTLKFLMTFDSFVRHRKSYVCFAYSGGGASLPTLNLVSSWIFLVLARLSPKPW
jgi:hypothetical protein